MSELIELRREIDKINNDIIELLNQRTSLVKEISILKDQTGEDYYNPEREDIMLEEVLKHNKGPLPDELVHAIFTTIFNSTLHFMGINKERRLMISTNSENKFKSIQEIFSLPTDKPVIIAGPCAIESHEFLDAIASFIHEKNLKFLRGGAYKPRTSPYEFQGLKEEGLKLLKEIGKKYDLTTVTEVVDIKYIDLVSKYADVIQIGARNMQNYELLKEVGQTHKPVLLKRGMSSTIQEFMLAAEYIALQGNNKIILCERGIRTFETKTRNTLDISSIPIIKQETKLPVIADLSHSLGRKDIVSAIAKAVLAAGADGIMIEVHPNPKLARSDSNQQLNIEEFNSLLNAININN